MSQANRAIFELDLTKEYERLFASDSRYAPAAARHRPSELAHKITLGLSQGGASKDGEGVKRVCKLLKIKHTYSAIKEYLNVVATRTSRYDEEFDDLDEADDEYNLLH
jgi:hypothetical protein